MTGEEIKMIKIRASLADYVASEGCSCCQNVDDHNKAAKELAKLLDIPEYDDHSGYDFYKFKTK